MVTNTVIGKKHKLELAMPGKNQKGFSLLELLIVMFIMVILVSIALPQYNSTILHAKETVLKDNLHQMRRQLDQYAADKGKLPQSLEDLVSAGYLREIPIDPMTEKADWETVSGEDTNSRDGASGIKDVKSSSTDTSSDGKSYNEF